MAKEPIGKETSQLLHTLHQIGVESYVVIMRHSARFVGTAENDESMGLTEEGKKAAYAFGKALPATPLFHFFSSPVGRCLETSSLIEQGYLATGGTATTNQELKVLYAFYVKDFPKFVQLYYDMFNNGQRVNFFRNWFDGDYSPELVADPSQATRKMVEALIKLLQKPAAGNICISHDWNLLLIKEFYLGLKPGEHKHIQYLEGIVIYEQYGRYYITNHQTEAKPIPLL